MAKEIEIWHFIAAHLKIGERVMLLLVAESNGSSPGRAGYKMAVAADGTLSGSIGGGVMEVSLVEQSRAILSAASAGASGQVIYQVHQKNAPNASGMICSGKQTVILRKLTMSDVETIKSIIASLESKADSSLTITPKNLRVGSTKVGTPNTTFEKLSENEFVYVEKLGPEHKLFIIGGGHCALALSELMSHLDFRITIFDDRPELNTIVKNQFADDIKIIDRYEEIGALIPSRSDTYVVIMTLGYKSDEVAIRQLFDRDFKYFGVLGSKAKMRTLLTTLKNEGFDKDWLGRIHTPIGLPINSHTPEEIAVSIAAEIIAVKNSLGRVLSAKIAFRQKKRSEEMKNLIVPKPSKRSYLRSLAGREYYVLKRRLRWLAESSRFARTDPNTHLEHSLIKHRSMMLRPLKDVEMYLQHNKVTNLRLAIALINGVIIRPGQTFSIWRLVGRPTAAKGYLEGLVLSNGRIEKGVGGGLCQLGNLLYWMALHSPLTVAERHHHGYDVFPDINRKLPFACGATLAYNYIDLQLSNDTSNTFQINLWLDDEYLNGEILSNCASEFNYEVLETDHLIKLQPWGGYTRHNRIWQRQTSRIDGLASEKLVTENHAIMMYNPLLTA